VTGLSCQHAQCVCILMFVCVSGDLWRDGWVLSAYTVCLCLYVCVCVCVCLFFLFVECVGQTCGVTGTG